MVRVMAAVGSAAPPGEYVMARRARTRSAVASEVHLGRLWLRGASRTKCTLPCARRPGWRIRRSVS